jgi:hypothetical protein
MCEDRTQGCEAAVSCCVRRFVFKVIVTTCFTCLCISNTAKLIEFFHSVTISCTEWRDPVSITPPYWEGPGFESRHTDRLSRRRVFVFFLCSTRTLPVWYLILGHSYFLPHPSQLIFIIHPTSYIVWPELLTALLHKP